MKLMTVIVHGRVFVRQVLNNSLHWAEPLAVLIMGWFIFFGAAVGIREGSPLSSEVALANVPGWMKSVFCTVSDMAIGAFGFRVVQNGWLRGRPRTSFKASACRGPSTLRRCCVSACRRSWCFSG